MAKILHNLVKQQLKLLPYQQQRHCRQRLSRRANREVPSGRPHRRGPVRSGLP